MKHMLIMTCLLVSFVPLATADQTVCGPSDSGCVSTSNFSAGDGDCDESAFHNEAHFIRYSGSPGGNFADATVYGYCYTSSSFGHGNGISMSVFAFLPGGNFVFMGADWSDIHSPWVTACTISAYQSTPFTGALPFSESTECPAGTPPPRVPALP